MKTAAKVVTITEGSALWRVQWSLNGFRIGDKEVLCGESLNL